MDAASHSSCAGDLASFTGGERRNLVVVRAGRSSLHAGWIAGEGEQDFDLLVATYEETGAEAEGEGVAVVHIPGPKIAGYHALFSLHPDLLERYDYIACIDDDIRTTKPDLNRLFAIGRRYDLDVFQPALSWDSHFSYAATLVSGGRYRLRYTNTVEMMCPVFSSRHLRRALPLFGLGYETGIDLIWTRIGGDPWFRYAIIDDVVVTHTRPVGATKTRQGFGENESYDAQVEAVLKGFGVRFRGFVTYAAIDRQGRLVRSRPMIALSSVATWSAWRQTPMSKRDFARFATDATRHCLYRPVNLERIGDRLEPSAPLRATLRPAAWRTPEAWP